MSNVVIVTKRMMDVFLTFMLFGINSVFNHNKNKYKTDPSDYFLSFSRYNLDAGDRLATATQL